MPERICLFGGTFDPIHKAHIRIAQEALTEFHLDRVIFVPAGNPPHKDPSSLAPYEDRLRMVELACKGHPKFQVSRLEAGKTRSYSVDTVALFAKSLACGERLFFLIGSDAFDEIETWHRWRDLLRMTEFIVVARPGHENRIPPGAHVHKLDGLALPISSSGIRSRLAAGGPTPELSHEVRRYIDARGLYGARPQILACE
jgi:nicotinate-nucleotide adenylyltransferase